MIRWSKSSPPRCVSPLVDLHLERALADLQDRDVERAAAEVVDGDDLLVRLVEAVGQRRRRRLVDDAQDVRGPAISPAAFVAWRCESLKYAGTVITASVTGVAEVGLGVRLQLLQDHRADLGRASTTCSPIQTRASPFSAPSILYGRIFRSRCTSGSSKLAAHQPLDREDRVLRVRHALPLGHLPDEPLARLRDGDDGRRRPPALRVRDDDGLAAFHDGDAAVRRSQVNSYCSWHCYASPSNVAVAGLKAPQLRRLFPVRFSFVARLLCPLLPFPTTTIAGRRTRSCIL